ncbi:DUF4159 domain-containing protein [Humisphaera borealis]|uniref:DUF4159 domain-containing protein n=1 Tax=Humisphaera borealis TaxID=2807512 RepID=A0A7M2WRT8_9BACT|nr:DUF4159 domain-containing protein [Humisphaera borealis]QOV87320.1 DUF4159 domain-containing protein [Humisphaera borealis]
MIEIIRAKHSSAPNASFRQSRGSRAWVRGAIASSGCLLALAALAVGQATAPATQSAPAAQPASAKTPGAPATAPAVTAAARPAPRPVADDPNVLTDKMVDDAIRKGAKFLLSKFDAKHWVDGVAEKIKEDEGYAGGLDSLAVYALMQSGLALPPGDDLHKELDLKGPGMTAKIDAMCKFDLDKGRHATYAYGLRATALALYITNLPDLSNQKERSTLQDKRDAAKALLMKDAAWCVMGTNNGGYTYPKMPGSPKNIKDLEAYYLKLKREKKLPVADGGYDNSNAQYGLLGAWSAAEAEIEIPSLYWYLVANHWMAKQLPNGQWPYSDGNERGGTVNMTAAGLASMLVTHEYIEPALMSGSVGREPYNIPIKKGLSWFETANNGISAGGGYGMYGVERVGLASGFKFFGQHDWYRVYAQRILKAQQPSGGWSGGGLGGGVVDTCYYLLFLSRGRHPILMNKLRFDGDAKTPGFWANRPRDAANLAKTISKKIERPLNWQVINVATHWEEWLDSPIMTIASHQPYKFSPEDLAKIRNYVEAGGILYVQADGSSSNMDKWATQLCADLFKRELLNVPPNHPIYSNESVYKISPPVPLKMATNGSRILMVYSSIDMARFWQARDNSPKARPYYEVAANLFYYAAGKMGFRNRLETLYVAEPKTPPVATFGVARLSYPAEWDPEPGAWKRFSNVFWRATGYKLTPTEVKINDLKPFDAARKNDPANIRFAHLTGTVKQGFKPEAVAAVKAFVESGGVLLIDIAGGSNPFDDSVQGLLKEAFPETALRPVPTSHPILAGGAPGMVDISEKRVLRPVVVEKLGRQHGLLMMLQAGKGAVVFSPIDVSSGLLGTNTGGIYGYEAKYSQDLMRNIILWAQDGAKGDAAPAPAAAAAAAEAK